MKGIKKTLIGVFLCALTALCVCALQSAPPASARAEETHTHKICGDSSCTDDSHDDLTWTGISDLNEITGDGNYYLTDNVTLSARWTNKYIVNLCLNGKTITGIESEIAIYTNKDCSFTVTDCQPDVGKITGGLHGISSWGELTLWNGLITGNVGQGVYNMTKFVMYGGSISGNGNHGVYNTKEFNMYGGVISGNKGSGVYNFLTFIMSGGKITGNTAQSFSGGVYNIGTLTLSGSPVIEGNAIGGTITDGVITGGNVGNVNMQDSGTITVTGALEEGASVGITAKNPTTNPTVVTGTTSTVGLFSDNEEYILAANDDGTGLKLTEVPVTIDVTLKTSSSGSEMTDNTKVYDGKAVVHSNETYTPNVSGVSLAYTWQEKSADGEYIDIDGNAAPVDAGSYRLKVTAKKNGNVCGTLELPFTVTPAKGVGIVTIEGWTYGGTANAPTVLCRTNGTDNVTYLYKVNGADDDTYVSTVPANAGNYTVKATFAATKNYNEATATANFTIAQKAVTATITAEDKVYDGTATAEASASLTGVVGDDEVTAKITSATFADKNVGSKTVTANITLEGAKSGNYKVNATATTTADITAKTLTATITAKNKTYDGNATAEASVSLTGVVGDDEVTAKITSAKFADKNVGSKTVTANITLEGAEAGNYTVNSTATTTANITAKALTATITANNKTYDGSATAEASVSLTGIVGDDEVTAKITSAKFADKNVGSKTVTANITLEGANASNYTVNATATATANITVKELTVTGATVTPKTYDGKTDAAITAVLFDGFVDGETFAFGTDYTVSGAAYDTPNAVGAENAATRVGFTVTLADTAKAKNYVLAANNGTQSAIIAKATVSDVTVEFTDSLTYNGSEQTLAIASVKVGDKEITYTVSGNTAVNAGSYTLTITCTGNYAGTITKSWSIAKAKVPVPSAVTGLVYSGKEQVGVAGGDLYTVTDGKATNAGSYTAIIALKDGSNYEWNGAFDGEIGWSIAKAKYDVGGISFNDKTFVADGSAKSIAVSGTLPSGVTVTYAGNGKAESGIYTVTATFAGDYDNYETIADMTATMIVKQASLADGSESAPDVIVSEDGGTDPGVRLVVIKRDEVSPAIDEKVKRDERVSAVYDVTLQSDGVSVQPDGTLTIKLLIPTDISGRAFRILHLHEGAVEEVEYAISEDGKYAVFTVDKLSEFTFVADNGGSALWLVILLAVIVAGEIVLIVLKKRKINGKSGKACAAGLFGGVIPVSQIVLLAVLGVAAIALGAYTVYLYTAKKDK